MWILIVYSYSNTVFYVDDYSFYLKVCTSSYNYTVGAVTRTVKFRIYLSVVLSKWPCSFIASFNGAVGGLRPEAQ